LLVVKALGANKTQKFILSLYVTNTCMIFFVIELA